MRNSFDAQCFRCGAICKRGQGHFEMVGRSAIVKYGPLAAKKKWLVQHAFCAAKYRGTLHHFLTANAPRNAPQPSVENVERPIKN